MFNDRKQAAVFLTIELMTKMTERIGLVNVTY